MHNGRCNLAKIYQQYKVVAVVVVNLGCLLLVKISLQFGRARLKLIFKFHSVEQRYDCVFRVRNISRTARSLTMLCCGSLSSLWEFCISILRAVLRNKLCNSVTFPSFPGIEKFRTRYCCCCSLTIPLLFAQSECIFRANRI